MKAEIKKGMTIIHTKEDHIGCRNKTGCQGISKYNNTNMLRVEISIKQKKYSVGIFDNLQDAMKARKVAETKKEAGCLLSWLASKPHGNTDNYIDFWKNEFEGIDGK